MFTNILHVHYNHFARSYVSTIVFRFSSSRILRNLQRRILLLQTKYKVAMATRRPMQLVALLCVSYTFAFQPVGPSTVARTALRNGKSDDEKESVGWNPIRALSEAFGSMGMLHILLRE
jgi:hypothetical protein